MSKKGTNKLLGETNLWESMSIVKRLNNKRIKVVFKHTVCPLKKIFFYIWISQTNIYKCIYLLSNNLIPSSYRARPCKQEELAGPDKRLWGVLCFAYLYVHFTCVYVCVFCGWQRHFLSVWCSTLVLFSAQITVSLSSGTLATRCFTVCFDLFQQRRWVFLLFVLL